VHVLRRIPLLVGAVSFVLFAVAAMPAAADSIPSGQRALGQSVSEPVYNDEQAGVIGYIKQPTQAPQPVPANPVAWAPFYLVVYPVGSTAATTFLCQHTPVENCPTHGNGIAALAQAREPGVYGTPGTAGVLGHDHLMDFPGGADFNIAWEPIVVLFTNSAAANEHILTDAQIGAAVSSGNAIEVPLPLRTFICSSVPATVYALGTPLS
jgi:hypothetical protein